MLVVRQRLDPRARARERRRELDLGTPYRGIVAAPQSLRRRERLLVARDRGLEIATLCRDHADQLEAALVELRWKATAPCRGRAREVDPAVGDVEMTRAFGTRAGYRQRGAQHDVIAVGEHRGPHRIARDQIG